MIPFRSLIITILLCCQFLLTIEIFAENKTTLQQSPQSLIDSSANLRNVSLEQSIITCRKAILLSENLKDPNLLSKAYKTQGINFYIQGDTDSSLLYYKKAITQFELLNSKIDIGKVVGNIGILYKNQNQYVKALDYYLENLKIFQEAHYDKGLGNVYNNLGNLYFLIKKDQYALKYYQLALNNFKKFNNSFQTANAYSNLGAIAERQKKYQQGLKYYRLALKENKKINNKLLESKLDFNIGYLYQSTEQLDSALLYLKKAERLRSSIGNRNGLILVKYQIGNLYYQLNQYSISKKYLQDALQLSNELSNHIYAPDILFNLAELYEEESQYQEALYYQQKAITIKDSINAINIENKFAELAAKYETEQKKKELQLLQQQTQIKDLELSQKNSWLIILAVVLILGVVAVFVSLRVNRLRADHKIMDLRQKVLLTQMNPHFLFNSLTAIQSFILDQRNNEANNYLARLATLVRGILENSREEFVSLRTELQSLEDYIALQKLRFDNEINYRFEVDASLDQDEIMVPPMLAQPFVENALIHGELRKNPDAQITIQVNTSEDRKTLIFSISDNGIGVNEAKKKAVQTHRKSLATTIALDRVKIYNFKSAQKMQFSILDLKDENESETGTKVTYSIPIIK